MELHAANVSTFKDCCVRNNVMAAGGGLVDDRAVVAVREIEIRAVDAFQQTRFTARYHLVPTHVGNSFGAVKAANFAGKNAETALAGSFFAGREQTLQP